VTLPAAEGHVALVGGMPPTTSAIMLSSETTISPAAEWRYLNRKLRSKTFWSGV
jgi:hypothetical protein